MSREKDLDVPGIFDLDLTVKKLTKITNRVGTEFRAEFFIMINHPLQFALKLVF